MTTLLRRHCRALLAALALTAALAPAAQAGQIREGDSGRKVVLLQRALGLDADGAFGPATLRAVKRFQRREGLNPNGIVGWRTQEALGLPFARSRRSAAKDEEAEAPAPVSLSRDAVMELQEALGVTADGAIGPQTRRAIRRYERRNGMVVDGNPDAELLEALGIDAETEDDAPPATGEWAEAIEAARSVLGTPHVSGGNDPDGFDCSGLVVWAFKQAGRKVPRTSYEQYEVGTAIDQDEIQAGDLVFSDTAGDGASHVGIAISPTEMISATSSKGVAVHPITTGYWGDHYIGARRL